MHKKVSIAVPVYNVESTLNRCVDSILNQTYKNFELILVDDCSTDNSLSMCYEYAKKDDRVIVVKKTSHTVLSDVRNVGIEHASGEYIMFIDSDDYVCTNFVEEMVIAIEEQNVDVVRCKAMIYKEDGSYEIENIHGRENKIFTGDEIKKYCKEISYFSEKYMGAYTWALIIKRNKMNVRFNPQVYCKQDIVFFVELLLESSISSIYFLDMPLYHYCYNNNSISNNKSKYYKYIDGVVACFSEVKKILSRNNLLVENIERGIDSTVFHMIRHKIYSLNNSSIFEIIKIIKYSLRKKELKEMLKNTDISKISMRWKILISLLKMHFYFSVAMYIKLFKK